MGSHRVSYHHCDVTDEKQVEETVTYTLGKHGGKLDILFSNAGILGPITGILNLDLEALNNVMAINVRGVAATIKYAARAMVANKTRGSIICTTSVAASVGAAGPVAYIMSKHALLGLVRSACAELGEHGIRVNSVSPHAIATPLTVDGFHLKADEVEAMTSGTTKLKGATLKAKDVAEAVVFLASDESGFISGHDLVVDGGLTVTMASHLGVRS